MKYARHFILGLAAVVGLGLLAGLSVPAQAQTPEASPTEEADDEDDEDTFGLCAASGAVAGGQPLPATNGAIVVPPSGGTYVLSINPPPSSQFSVCYVEGNSEVTINNATCDEIDRQVGSADGAEVLDEIVESCTRVAAPTATPSDAATVTPPTPVPAQTGGVITAPNTGSAGLK